LCSDPVVVEEVGRHRSRQCLETTRAMQTLAARACAHDPDLVVLLTAAAPRDSLRWGVCTASRLSGHFGSAGAEQVGVVLPGALDAATQLLALAREAGLLTQELDNLALNDAARVPMHFLQHVGWHGPTLWIAAPPRAAAAAERMGALLARVADQAQQRWTLIVCGDLSRRLKPGAGTGYHPLAKDFDSEFRGYIEAADLRRATGIDHELRAMANETVLDPLAVAAGAIDYAARGPRTFSYEAPFGVGYLVAMLDEPAAPRGGRHMARDNRPWLAMLQIARGAIAARIDHNPYRPPPLPHPWNAPHGVFVTLRKADGSERSSAAHVVPQYTSLAEDIAVCATSAALQDTRFARLTLAELQELYIEITLISKPEPISDAKQLDPQRYGVVVSGGRSRGAVLPEQPGVNTVEQQLTAAAVKGQLPAGRPWTLERFEVISAGIDTAEALQAHRARRFR
jgi:AMMECR1 domain-containing protein/aromatic ring-opening dioxygenase LigB subunit